MNELAEFGYQIILHMLAGWGLGELLMDKVIDDD